MRPHHWLLLGLGLALYLAFKWPSASSVVAHTVISAVDRTIEYKSVRYEAEWGPETEHSGDIRLIDRAKYKSAPFFTHHLLLTTGEYSDPNVVKIGDSGGGNFYWTAKKQPEGSLVALHLVPRDRSVLDQIKHLDDGDAVTLIGREEVDGSVVGSNGSYLRLNHNNHKYLLVERVERPL